MKKTKADMLHSLYSQVWKRIQLLPGVRGLGIGARGWRIYVDNGLNSNTFDQASVPSGIAGFPTEVVSQQPTFPCYGNDFQDTLKPGIQIVGKGVSGTGSLGCFARLTSDHKTIVLLSAGHVLYEDLKSGSGGGNKCGQPDVSCCCCHVIGRNRGNGSNGFNQVSVEFTHPSLSGINTSDGSEIDCAVSVLNNKRPYTNESQYYQMIKGTPPSGLGVSGGDPVEKVGSETGHTKGTICQFNFTSVKYDTGGSGPVPNILFPIGQENTTSVKLINQFLVLPDPDPNDPSGKAYFAFEGDSGSVVVNSEQQVIGLLIAMLPLDARGIAKISPFLTKPIPPYAGNLGVVSPIGKILPSLGIEIVDNMQGTVPSAGATLTVPDDVLRERERVLAIERQFQALQREICEKAMGKEVLERIKEHRSEVARLIEKERAVKVAWHRCQGPAYVAHCMRSLEDRRHVIPHDVDGITPLELIQRMARVLKAHGSDRLQHDVGHYELLALDLIAGCNSVWQLVDRIRELNPVQYGEEQEVTLNSGVSE
jgi:hypothetical protein